MRRQLLLMLGMGWFCAVSPQWAMARYHGPGPGGEPITQGLLKVGADGSVTLTKPVWKEVAEQHIKNVEVEETVEENGKSVVKKKIVPETYMTTRRVSTAVYMAIPQEKVALFDTAGKAVTLASVRSRLDQPTLVLVTEDGKLHPSYAGLFKQETLVLAYSSRPVAAPPGAVPAPRQDTPPPPPAAQLQPARRAPQVQFVQQPAKQANAPETAKPKSLFPDGPAPTFRYCQLQDQGKTVAVRHFFESQQPLTLFKKVSKDGVEKMVPYQLVKTIGADETTLWDRNMVKFLTVAGKPADAARISAMSRETAVIASADDQPVDKFWLQNINPDATVIVLPRFSDWQPQAPVPAGPAPATVPPSEA